MIPVDAFYCLKWKVLLSLTASMRPLQAHSSTICCTMSHFLALQKFVYGSTADFFVILEGDVAFELVEYWPGACLCDMCCSLL